MMRNLKFGRPFHIRTPFSLYTLDYTNLILLYIMYRTTGLISKKVHRIKNIFGRFIGYVDRFLVFVQVLPYTKRMLPRNCLNLNLNLFIFFCKCLCFLLDKIPVCVCENQYRIRRGRRTTRTSCRDSIHHEDNIVESTFSIATHLLCTYFY